MDKPLGTMLRSTYNNTDEIRRLAVKHFAEMAFPLGQLEWLSSGW
jgi:hypothetical protein